MEIKDRLKLAYKALTSSPSVPENNELFKALNDLIGGWRYKYNPKFTEYQDGIKSGYQQNPHVYSVVNYIASQISKIPFEVMEVTDEKAYRDYQMQKKGRNYERALALQQKAYSKKSMKPASNKILIDLIAQPNETQSFEEFIYSSIGYKKLTGNDYIYGLNPAGFDEDLFSKIYDMPSQLISINFGDFYSPVKSYSVSFFGSDKVEIDSKKVLHRKEWNPEFEYNVGNVYGMSPLMSLKNVIVRTNNAKEASVALFRNGVPAGILSNDSGLPMTDDDMSKVERQMDSKFGGGKNKNRILQSSKKFSWQSLGLSSVDMEILNAEKADLIDVCRVYKVPSVLMENGEQSTYNNVAEAEKRFWGNCAIPEIENFCGNINRWLLAPWGRNDGKKYVLDYDLRAIPALQDDMKTLSDRLLHEMENGLWTPNQVREMMDKEIGTEEHLNKFYFKQGLVAVDPNPNPISKLLQSFSPLVANNMLQFLTDKQIAELTGATEQEVQSARANAKPQPNLNINANG